MILEYKTFKTYFEIIMSDHLSHNASELPQRDANLRSPHQ